MAMTGNSDGTVMKHTKVTQGLGGFTGDLDEDDWFGSGIANMGDLDSVLLRLSDRRCCFVNHASHMFHVEHDSTRVMLLEDRFGTAFSGMYASIFLANQGGRRDRLQALVGAIKEVYARTLDGSRFEEFKKIPPPAVPTVHRVNCTRRWRLWAVQPVKSAVSNPPLTSNSSEANSP